MPDDCLVLGGIVVRREVLLGNEVFLVHGGAHDNLQGSTSVFYALMYMRMSMRMLLTHLKHRLLEFFVARRCRSDFLRVCL